LVRTRVVCVYGLGLTLQTCKWLREIYLFAGG
jgi:hypothetical protein